MMNLREKASRTAGTQDGKVFEVHGKNRKRILSLIDSDGLLEQCEKVGLALSGGRDSIFLLHHLVSICREREIDLMALHVNHGLRENAAADMEFCEIQSRSLGIEFHSWTLDAAEVASGGENTLREARYLALGEMAERSRLDRIFLGHHLEDQAETFLLRLFQGTDLRGLRGMSSLREGFWARPLLQISRKDIDREIEDRALSFVEDSTNSELHYRRNYLRNRIVPELENEFNPAISRHLASLSQSISEVFHGLRDLAERELKAYSDPGIDLISFRNQPRALQKTILQLAYERVASKGAAMSRVQLDQVLRLSDDEGSGRFIHLSLGVLARKEGGRLIFAKYD